MTQRRYPIGAEVLADGRVDFRVWAPRCKHVTVQFEPSADVPQPPSQIFNLTAEANGYFSGSLAARVGTRYRFILDDQQKPLPDPASRFQPDGPHGASQVIDPGKFPWTDKDWKGVRLAGQVMYEMHIGTFTPEGTWAAAQRQLAELASLGVTCLEIMPVADFTGTFGWGYDGVNFFAPTRLYGSPDDFRRFVDAAHGLGIGVILDVVYNHFGPDGNYLPEFSTDYATDRYNNEWGEAVNFDGPNSGPVREFFATNAAYWIAEFHLDGLRLDATQQIFDRSDDHIMAVLGRDVRKAAGGRETIIVAENETQDTRLVRPSDRAGFGLDGLWNDDYHHSLRVALTGHREAYFTDYRGDPQELLSAIKWGYLYQGQFYRWQDARRGTPALDLHPEQFIVFLENHDQIANSGNGERRHRLASPGRFRALTALFLLGPNTPMLFQGQEFSASSPFLYFADHRPELAKLVRDGRAKFLAQFPSLALPEVQNNLPAPADRTTFDRCKLDFSDRERNKSIYALHRDLLRIRREDPVLHSPRPRGVDGAIFGSEAFALRFFAADGLDRLLIVNYGREFNWNPAPEPLLAPPLSLRWVQHWSSNDLCYGGSGTPALETRENWWLPGETAVLLIPQPLAEATGKTVGKFRPPPPNHRTPLE